MGTGESDALWDSSFRKQDSLSPVLKSREAADGVGQDRRLNDRRSTDASSVSPKCRQHSKVRHERGVRATTANRRLATVLDAPLPIGVVATFEIKESTVAKPQTE